ncbi:MAG: hypothetical protein KME64_17430 [Scytonematopsis contorta HA4267-MV1]|nr:hypothetical protein [Scytonematopsis contorta HA4267-MV1]
MTETTPNNNTRRRGRIFPEIQWSAVESSFLTRTYPSPHLAAIHHSVARLNHQEAVKTDHQITLCSNLQSL